MSAITFNIWSVLILLGAAQGFFLSVFMLTQKGNNKSNTWLALLLLVISFHLLEYAAAISGVTFQFPFLISITYPLLFCMGPFYYFYCIKLLDKNQPDRIKSLLHLLPSVLVVILMLPFYMMPGDDKTAYIQSLSSGGKLNIPAGQLVFMSAHLIQTVVYVILSYKLIHESEKEYKTVTSDVDLIKKLHWLKKFSFYFSVYLVLYLMLVVTLVFTDSFHIHVDYIMLFITSCAVYSIGYFAISGRDFPFPGTGLESNVKNVSGSDQTSGTPTAIFNKYPDLKEQLLYFMETNKPYLKSDLKISELANSLSVPPYQLSQHINNEFSCSFYDFVNKYRVEEAKKLLVADPENNKILAVAFETGFNSKATFNRVFKSFTNLTPSEYRQQNPDSN